MNQEKLVWKTPKCLTEEVLSTSSGTNPYWREDTDNSYFPSSGN
jgi:hypothetical protein